MLFQVCHVEAYPPPTITWTHDNIQLNTNQLFVVDSGFTTSDDFTETSVRIKKLGPRLLGSYTCRAQNKLGITEKEIVVEQTYEPNCVVGLCYAGDAQRPARPNAVTVLGAVLAAAKILL